MTGLERADWNVDGHLCAWCGQPQFSQPVVQKWMAGGSGTYTGLVACADIDVPALNHFNGLEWVAH
jgi:hypothetical protein